MGDALEEAERLFKMGEDFVDAQEDEKDKKGSG
jgi:hypothetical protein